MGTKKKKPERDNNVFLGEGRVRTSPNKGPTGGKGKVECVVYKNVLTGGTQESRRRRKVTLQDMPTKEPRKTVSNVTYLGQLGEKVGK